MIAKLPDNGLHAEAPTWRVISLLSLPRNTQFIGSASSSHPKKPSASRSNYPQFRKVSPLPFHFLPKDTTFGPQIIWSNIMGVWFQCKVKFLKETSEGLFKSVTEQYLVDALSFTEAEGRALQDMPSGRGEITMMSIQKSNIREVAFYGDTDMWFKAKVSYVVVEEETEKEKRITTYILVNASDLREAYDRVQEHLKEMLVPFLISKIEESPIIDVFEYQKSAPEGFTKVEGSEKPAPDLSGWDDEEEIVAEEEEEEEMVEEEEGEEEAGDEEEEFEGEF